EEPDGEAFEEKRCCHFVAPGYCALGVASGFVRSLACALLPLDCGTRTRLGRAQFQIKPAGDRPQRTSQKRIKRRIDQSQSNDGEKHHERRAHQGLRDLRAHLVRPFRRDFQHFEPAALQRVEQVYVEREVGGKECVVDLFDGGAAHHLGRALRVLDVEPEQSLDYGVKAAAGEAAQARLALVQNRAGKPARTDHAVRLVAQLREFEERLGTRGAVGVHVTDQIGHRRQAQTFDQRAALADRLGIFESADRGIFLRHAADHADGVVAAAIEHHHELELARVMFLGVLGVFNQHRLDAVLLIVRRDEQEQAVRWLERLGHRILTGKKRRQPHAGRPKRTIHTHPRHGMFTSRLMPNFSTRFRRVARVMPSSWAACTWFPLVSWSAWMMSSRSMAGSTLSLGSCRAQRKSILASDASSVMPFSPVAAEASWTVALGAEPGSAISGGRSTGKMTSPLATTMARWITFSSSRTFPGQ